ncbi:MAG: M23 family metallopeptidase [Myxococcales bacterium]|nr:M23 family metallopeptidase [Myxococcales bacterium]
MSVSFKDRRRNEASGMVWPDSGTDTPSSISDVFGGRPYAEHIDTVGYDYDMHRGVDVPLNEGDDFRSPITGRVARVHRSHFRFRTDYYQRYWTEDDDGYGTSWAFNNPGVLMTGTRGGSTSWPTVDKYQNFSEKVNLTAGQWEFRVKLAAGQGTINGAFGFGMFDPVSSEYIMLEWDGTNVRFLGTYSGGNLSNHNTTAAVTSGHLWLRVRSSGTTIQWATSSDGDTWTNKATETNPSFTNGTRPVWVATMYYRSKDTNASADVVTIDSASWYDSDGIGRFGNWPVFIRTGDKVLSYHFDDLYVERGDYVDAGDVIGTVGLTGFDDRSGSIATPHVHLEYATNSRSAYDNDDAINPLRAGVLPRVNVSNNVSVVVSSAQDPDSIDSHKLVITCNREAQDFDMSEFSLTGNTNTRTINWDTRSGLNADNDIPKNNGVYIVPSSFNSSSSTYVVTIYFNKSTVGSTLVSAYIKDSNGVTLWSI